MPEAEVDSRIDRQASTAPPEELDALALERARRGEEAGLRALFQMYHRRVFAYLWRMLGPWATKEAVEDLLQDVFLRVFASLPGFSPSGPAKLSTWILTIAHRLALNELRRSKVRRSKLALAADGQVEPASVDGPEGRLALGQKIMGALAALPSEQRSVFLLADYHGLGPEEVSRAADIPVGTAKSRLHRARAALRKALESEDD